MMTAEQNEPDLSAVSRSEKRLVSSFCLRRACAELARVQGLKVEKIRLRKKTAEVENNY